MGGNLKNSTKDQGHVQALDPVWDAIGSNARDIVAAEPAFGSLIAATILNYDRFEDALAHRLAERLGHPDLSADLIRQAFGEALDYRPEIGAEARADLAATMERDPACHRAIEPLLYFKGYQAIQTHRFANALSETGGKNVQDIRTRLVAEGDGYRIDGRKGYCTGSLYAHWLGVLALDEQDRAQLAFVPRESAGLTVVDDWDSIGQRTTSSGTVLLDGLRVPAFHLFPSYRSYESPTLAGPFAQITTAAIDAGIARAALRDTIAFVREQARPWIDAGVEKASEDPLTIIQVGGLDIRLEAAEALLERAGYVLDAGKAAPDEDKVAAASLAVARAKVLTTAIVIEASNKLFELGGTRSTLRKHNLDRHWRNARVHTLHDPVRWKCHLVGNWLLNGKRPPRHDWN